MKTKTEWEWIQIKFIEIVTPPDSIFNFFKKKNKQENNATFTFGIQ